MGIVQYYVVISGHEAVHKTLCLSARLNEFFGVFGQVYGGRQFYSLQTAAFGSSQSKRQRFGSGCSHLRWGCSPLLPVGGGFLYLTLGTFIEIAIKIRQKGSGIWLRAKLSLKSTEKDEKRFFL